MRLLAPGVVLDNAFNLHLPESFILPIYCCKVRYDAGASLPSHIHPYYEIFCVSQGTCICSFGDEECALSESDICVVRSGEMHSVQASGISPCEHILVHTDLSNSPEFDSVFHQSNIKRISGCTDLLDELTVICDQAGMTQLGAAHMVHALFTIWLVKLTRRLGYSDLTHRATHEYSLDVEMAQEFIDQNAYFKLSPSDVARAVGVSLSSLSQRFSREMNMSVFQYVRLVLMQRAARMLEERKLTVSEIARMLGFPSIHYFSNYFKKYWNISPRAYQQQAYSKPRLAANQFVEPGPDVHRLAYFGFPILPSSAHQQPKGGLTKSVENPHIQDTNAQDRNKPRN